MTQPQESPPESFLEKAESISHIVQAFAILAAGIWAFYSFVYEDRIKPASEPPITTLTTTLTPVGEKGSLIAIQTKTQLRNIGKIRIRLLAYTFNVKGVVIQAGKSEEKHPAYVNRSIYSKEATSQFLMKNGELLTGASTDANSTIYLDPGEPIEKDFIVFIPKNKFDLIRMKSIFAFTTNLTQTLSFKLEQITPQQSQENQGVLLAFPSSPLPRDARGFNQNESTTEISLWK